MTNLHKFIFPLFAAAGMAAASFADVAVTNLTAQNWQGRMNEAMGKFAQARNQRDRQVYLDAFDTALYIATNCPGMDDAAKLVKLANYGFTLAGALGRDGYATGGRENQRLGLLRLAAERNETPACRFDAALELAKRECLVCADADLPRAEAALKALFTDAKWDALARLDKLSMLMHERLPCALDVLDAAAVVKAQSKDPAVQKAYYLKMADYMSTMYGGWEWGREQPGLEPVNPRYSYESQLALIEKGLADPLVADKIPLHYRRAWILGKLERFAEAEQVYLSQTVNTNLAERADAFVNYARFLEGRAVRYYTPSWQPYLNQAVAAYRQAILVGVQPRTPGNWGYREQAAECAMNARDYSAAREFLNGIVAAGKGRTNDFVRVRLGRIAWAEKDYEGVVAFYPPVDSPLNIKEQYPVADRACVVKALKLLGREEEELKALEALKDKADRNWKSYYTFAYERLKAKLNR